MKTVALAVAFAATCLALPSFALQDGKSFEELQEDVADEDGRKRRTAVRRLSELDTPAAWELVVERFVDEDPQVADEAQLRLAALDDDELWEDLVFGRAGSGHKDPLVRRRVAEALGRANAPLDAKRVADLLKDKDPAVQRLAAWSVERLADADGPGFARFDEAARGELVEALVRHARKAKDGAAAGAALLAAQRVESRVDENASVSRACAIDLAADWDDGGPAAVGGLLALGRTADEALFVTLTEAGASDVRPARLAAVTALGEARSLAGVRGLVAVLEAEPKGDAARRTVAFLQQLSGQRHRTDPRPWRDWVDGLGDDWVPANAGADGLDGDDGTVTQLKGLPIRSERLALLIDMSGSMWQKRDDGRATKELVDVEVRRCLEALPESARFNLIPYATEPDPYDDELVKVSSKKVAKALEWFEDNDLRGKGNVWDAIDVALLDPDVDTLVIMGDGAPSGGPHWNLELMVPMLLERNRFRQVTFDVLLSEAPGNLVRYWEELAGATDGTCLEVTFDA